MRIRELHLSNKVPFEVRSALKQMTDELNQALQTVEKSGGASGMAMYGGPGSGSNPQQSQKTPQETFNSIKSLIIKSADIVDAYYEQMQVKMSGDYVAQSQFGDYQEKVDLQITQNAKDIDEQFKNMQEISGTVDGIYDSQIETEAWIKRGLLDYAEDGTPIYGIEVGQTNQVDGVDTFEKFARFTSDRLSFYDQNGTEVAYFSDYRLHITNAEISGNLIQGGYRIDSTDGLAWKWIGRG